MEKFDSQIRELFRREVTDKLKLPAIAFGLFAIYTLVTALGCTRFAIPIQAISVLIVLLSFLRLKLFYQFQQSGDVQDLAYWRLRYLVWANGFSYGLIFTLGSLEHQFSGVYYMTILGMICGFVSASMITVSGDLLMFVPFSCFLLLPQILLLGFDLLGANRYHAGGVLLIYSVYLFYQIKCVYELRARWEQAFTDQLQVIESAKEIKLGHKLRSEQDLKIMHTSRLASLGEMASGIAHEVNNPLTVVSVSLEMIKRKLADMNENDRQAIIPFVEKSLLAVQRVGKITNGLKNFSRQSDHTPKQEVSILSIIDDTIDFCGEILRARHVNLRVKEIPQSLKVKCHPIQISQVLVNLIKNAEDAVAGKAESERWIEVAVHESETISIQVSNGGPLIPGDVQERMFNTFFSTKAEGEGTGLGLSISREIARDHGGDLNFVAHSQVTTFDFQLPKS